MGSFSLGRSLIFAGAALLVIGVLVLAAGKLPWIGKLPGDIVIQREGFRLYFPLTTCILVSIVLSLVLRFFTRR